MLILMFLVLFFFKKNTAYEMRISDWSSDVCSSDLLRHFLAVHHHVAVVHPQARHLLRAVGAAALRELVLVVRKDEVEAAAVDVEDLAEMFEGHGRALDVPARTPAAPGALPARLLRRARLRSEEPTSELQSLMRISYAVF